MVRWLSFLCFQGQVVNTVTVQNLAIEGFTGKKVWSNPFSKLFPGSPEESFLRMKVVDSGQGNDKS